MIELPTAILTTREFSDTVRWIRSTVFGVSFEDLLDWFGNGAADSVEGPTRALRAVESAGSQITENDLNCYSAALLGKCGESVDSLMDALAVAHFCEESTTRQLSDQLASERMHSRDRAHSVILGADLTRPDFVPVIVSSCAPLPAAADHLTPLHAEGFAYWAATIATDRDGLLVVPYSVGEPDRFHRPGVRGRTPAYAGLPDHVSVVDQPLIDPLEAITTLRDAWRVAVAMGAATHEVAALAWAMLLTHGLARRTSRIPILFWSELDRQGPQGYEDALGQLIATSSRVVIPASDAMWSVARRYLSPWHGEYGRTTVHLDAPPTDPGAPALDVYPSRDPLPEGSDLLRHTVFYDPAALPGLAEVLGCITPALHVTDIALTIHADQRPQAVHWLPTGISKRILARLEGSLIWLPILLA